jgi:acetoacetyl-CoA synthetase
MCCSRPFDATLKPGGVRIATADLYAALSGLPYLEEALAVGYTPKNDRSEKIVLFVVLKVGSILNKLMQEEIVDKLRKTNHFYAPSLIISAPELPRTTNNKLAEVAVKKILAGKDPGNRSALNNPDSLQFFETVGRAKVQAVLGI